MKKNFPKKVNDTSKNISITGSVADERGNGISSASVTIKGTNIGTVCDSAGNFNLNYKSDGQVNIIISAVGFRNVEKVINNSDHQSINLKLHSHILGEVVVVGVVPRKK